MSCTTSSPSFSSFILSCGVTGMSPCLTAAKLGLMSIMALKKGRESMGEVAECNGFPDVRRVITANSQAPTARLHSQNRTDHSSAMNRLVVCMFVLLGTIQPSPAAKIVAVAGGGTAERDAPALECKLREPF